MKLMKTCREVTQLVLQGQDRRLSVAERMALRVHWLACENCRRFRQQAATMQQAMARWRAYKDDGGP